MEVLKIEAYNLDQAVKVLVQDRRKVRDLYYQPFKKHIFRKDTPEGYQGYWASSTIFTEQDLKNGEYCDTKLLVDNKVAYWMPRVVISFSDESKFEKEFDKFEEAKKWAADDIFPKIKNISILIKPTNI